MGAIVEWINNLECTAQSPDGSVHSRLAGRKSIEVKLSPTALREHSENSLAKQVEVAVHDVLMAYQTAVDKRRYGDRDPVRLAEEGNRFVRRQLEFQKAAVEVAAVGISKLTHVKIDWRGIADIQVRIKPNTIPRLDGAQLSDEINSGIAAAARSRSRQILRLNEQFYGPVPCPTNKSVRHE